MARKKTVTLILAALAPFAAAQVPLPSAPSWNSIDSDYSTGGTLCDVNGDGRLDFAVSSGNDMANNRNAVYYNIGGTFETAASWRSSDRGMFGHCYSGDVTGDGKQDVAVVVLGPDSAQTPLVARLYRNTGTELESTPGWRARDRHSSFDCCLGDFDLDGRLDLAVSAGDAYANQRDPARAYRNVSGAFETLPSWSAAFDTASDAIRFCDIDDDGDLDLFVGHRRQVSMFRNNGGVLETAPSWKIRRGVGWVLRLAFGDFDQDGRPDLAVASNGQLGDSNSVRVYRNNNGALDTVASYVMLRSNRYSSCVAWGDVDGDGYPELAAGGWWEPAVVFDNNAGVLSTTPDWSWRPANIQHLVCEALIWADVRNRALVREVHEVTGDGARKLWSLSRAPVQFLDSVTVDGQPVPADAWCGDPLVGWFSLAAAPNNGAQVRCVYRYATRLDLAVTNWATNAGTRNLLFLNSDTTGIVAGPEARSLPGVMLALPNPFSTSTTLRLNPRPGFPAPTVHVYDALGRRVRVLAARESSSPTPFTVLWDGRDETGREVRAGVYLAVDTETGAQTKLVRH